MADTDEKREVKQLYLRFLTGSEIVIDYTDEETIWDLKEKAAKANPDLIASFLIFVGDEDDPLEDHLSCSRLDELVDDDSEHPTVRVIEKG